MEFFDAFGLHNLSQFHILLDRIAEGKDTRKLSVLVIAEALYSFSKRFEAVGQGALVFVLFASKDTNFCHNSLLMV